MYYNALLGGRRQEPNELLGSRLTLAAEFRIVLEHRRAIVASQKKNPSRTSQREERRVNLNENRKDESGLSTKRYYCIAHQVKTNTQCFFGALSPTKAREAGVAHQTRRGAILDMRTLCE